MDISILKEKYFKSKIDNTNQILNSKNKNNKKFKIKDNFSYIKSMQISKKEIQKLGENICKIYISLKTFIQNM